MVVIVFAEVGSELIDDEIDLLLGWLTVMGSVGKFISSAHHGVAKVIDDEDEAAVFGLRDYNAVIVLKHALLEDEMCAPRRHDALIYLRLVHLTDFISVHARTIHHNFRFDFELFLLRVHPVDTDGTNDFSSFILQHAFHLDVVGESGTGHSWDVIVDSSSEEAIKVHARVMHLCFRHDTAPLAMQRLHIGVSFSKRALTHYAGPTDRDLIVRAHQLL